MIGVVILIFVLFSSLFIIPTVDPPFNFSTGSPDVNIAGCYDLTIEGETYNITDNFVANRSSCLNITADNITIIGNSFTINGSGYSLPISSGGYYFEIYNLTFANFSGGGMTDSASFKMTNVNFTPITIIDPGSFSAWCLTSININGVVLENVTIGSTNFSGRSPGLGLRAQCSGAQDASINNLTVDGLTFRDLHITDTWADEGGTRHAMGICVSDNTCIITNSILENLNFVNISNESNNNGAAGGLRVGINLATDYPFSGSYLNYMYNTEIINLNVDLSESTYGSVFQLVGSTRPKRIGLLENVTLINFTSVGPNKIVLADYGGSSLVNTYINITAQHSYDSQSVNFDLHNATIYFGDYDEPEYPTSWQLLNGPLNISNVYAFIANYSMVVYYNDTLISAPLDENYLDLYAHNVSFIWENYTNVTKDVGADTFTLFGANISANTYALFAQNESLDCRFNTGISELRYVVEFLTGTTKFNVTPNGQTNDDGVLVCTNVGSVDLNVTAYQNQTYTNVDTEASINNFSSYLNLTDTAQVLYGNLSSTNSTDIWLRRQYYDIPDPKINVELIINWTLVE
uniref:Uncharacterized protein n=1 Tax=viral metagenome TaxID=1070528 RepID=A0A6M3IJ66_9ZZZZ